MKTISGEHQEGGAPVLVLVRLAFTSPGFIVEAHWLDYISISVLGLALETRLFDPCTVLHISCLQQPLGMDSNL